MLAVPRVETPNMVPKRAAAAAMVERPLHGGGGTIERHGEVLTHDADRQINLGHAAQDRRDQIAGVKTGRVARHGRLVIRATVDIVEDRPGQPSLGEATEIMVVVAGLKAHRSGLTWRHRARRDWGEYRFAGRGLARIGFGAGSSGSVPMWPNGVAAAANAAQ